MELNVVEPLAKQFHVGVGISEERSNEISNKMDTINREHFASKDAASYALLVQKIAKICNTNEEFAYAVTNNYNWLVITGRISVKQAL